MKTIIGIVVGLSLIGCAHREDGWGSALLDGKPANYAQSGMTVTEYPGYFELVFEHGMPPSDLFTFSHSRLAGEAFTIQARVGSGLVDVPAGMFKYAKSGNTIAFLGWQTTWPDCGSARVNY